MTDAELVMLAHAKKFPVGRFVYLECLQLPESTWDLRTLRFRTIANRLAKQILGGWKKIQKGGRMIWVRDNSKQMDLPGISYNSEKSGKSGI